MRSLGGCLALTRRLLPALLALAVLTGIAAAHEAHANPIPFADALATAAADDAGDHDDGCVQHAAGLQCSGSGCAQGAETGEAPFPYGLTGGHPLVTGGERLGSLRSRPVLQPPILAASA
jgi:hypothetical protein